MSNYSIDIDFIVRTINILDSVKTSYEKTLFLNCCVGLLFIPQNTSINGKPIVFPEIVSQNEWGIAPDAANPNETFANFDRNSVQNIARHIRNSIAHARFDMLECNRGVDMSEIKYIELFDKYSEKDNDYNFHLRLSIDDLLKFVRKYSEKVLKMKGVNLNKNGKESG